ncbi:uracil-DNA glycosylase family protein [Persicirhabdus sediminis]|uniref:Single-stranded DNA-binding protein n=1 Tax=Persicirhabdus sediminis TaxID=454144 RepID=A0A8J7MFR6_9BACT|nr:uracil-DNA glycosylase family protein [Persicirhabdus sediminis]MBK1790984.1 single-stranded DNA-binding protein [Persicirhabdus sediminis]
MSKIANQLEKAAKLMVNGLRPLKFTGDVTHVYNPLEYAWKPHQMYLERYGNSTKRVLMLGMNPGPWGMAQTGIPFGEIPAVRDWMKISADVKKPKLENPKRPVVGFACEKSEVSGRRLWGLFAEKYPSAEDFFADHFVTNYCPLVWMAETGRNITPDKIKKAEMAPVEELCRLHLAKMIELMEPEFLIGVGAYAEKKLQEAVEFHLPDRQCQIGKILHPSPASPAANRGWAEQAERQLVEQGVW